MSKTDAIIVTVAVTIVTVLLLFAVERISMQRQEIAECRRIMSIGRLNFIPPHLDSKKLVRSEWLLPYNQKGTCAQLYTGD